MSIDNRRGEENSKERDGRRERTIRIGNNCTQNSEKEDIVSAVNQVPCWWPANKVTDDITYYKMRHRYHFTQLPRLFMGVIQIPHS